MAEQNLLTPYFSHQSAINLAALILTHMNAFQAVVWLFVDQKGFIHSTFRIEGSFVYDDN